MSTHKSPGKPFISFDRNFGFYVNQNITISFGVSYKLLISVFLFFYLLWETYWAYNAGYKFIKWHTHLAFWIYVWLLFWFGLRVFKKTMNADKYLKFQLVFNSIFIAVFFVEILLTVTGFVDTYTEKMNFGYISQYSLNSETFYRTRTPNKVFTFIRPEFTHARQINSLGFADVEWPVKKTARQKRILCLGDSFTEGMGAEEDSTYVSCLSYIIKPEDSTCLVMNAGTAGNDPYVNFVNYRDRLSVYKPDVIIQTLSVNDVLEDIALRGGMERFLPAGNVSYKRAPWWEPLYAISYVVRLFYRAAGYNELLVRQGSISKLKKEIDTGLVNLFKMYAELAVAHNAKLMLVLQPHSNMINRNCYTYDFSEIVNRLNGIPGLYIYDLLPYYSDYIKNSKMPVGFYYWPQDGHHNHAGYRMMAEGAKAGLDSFHLME